MQRKKDLLVGAWWVSLKDGEFEDHETWLLLALQQMIEDHERKEIMDYVAFKLKEKYKDLRKQFLDEAPSKHAASRTAAACLAFATSKFASEYTTNWIAVCSAAVVAGCLTFVTMRRWLPQSYAESLLWDFPGADLGTAELQALLHTSPLKEDSQLRFPRFLGGREIAPFLSQLFDLGGGSSVASARTSLHLGVLKRNWERHWPKRSCFIGSLAFRVPLLIAVAGAIVIIVAIVISWGRFAGVIGAGIILPCVLALATPFGRRCCKYVWHFRGGFLVLVFGSFASSTIGPFHSSCFLLRRLHHVDRRKAPGHPLGRPCLAFCAASQYFVPGYCGLSFGGNIPFMDCVLPCRRFCTECISLRHAR
jgi:hypothetical protein